MVGNLAELRVFVPRSAKLALVAGLVAVAVAVVAVLSQSPLTVAGTNSVPAPNKSGFIRGNTSICVSGGTIPQNTTAIRIPLGANAGPTMGVKVFSGARVLTAGTREAGWGVEDTVTVPVARVVHAANDTRVCIAIGPTLFLRAYATVLAAASPRDRGPPVDSRMEYLRLEYLRPAPTSWWSIAPTIARHLGLGHAAAGIWNALFVLALMLAVVLLVSLLLLGKAGMHARSRAEAPVRVLGKEPKLARRGRAALRRVPRTAWICALIACLNAVCWSIITPPFQIPDEPSHFAYVQQLAENHRVPTSEAAEFSPEEKVVLGDLHQEQVRWHPEIHTISTEAEQRKLQDDLARHPSRRGNGVEGAASEPPLYYLLESIPYTLASSGTLLDQLALMRLLSALMAGITALFVFLFVRETLPAAPRAWIVGGAGVALVPTLGYMSGAVNPDSMLSAVSAAVFYCLGRAFRRGLTLRRAVLLGVLTAVGLLTKLNFIGLAPGVMIGLIVLSARVSRVHGRRTALRFLGVAIAIAVSPACIYVLINLVSNHPALGIVATTLKLRAAGRSVFSEASYIWQFYLPRMHGMTSYFPGLSMTRQVWFDKSVGFYGWLDTSFSLWVDKLALVPVGLITLLFLRALLARASAVRAHLSEIVVYGAIGAGLAFLLGASAYYNLNESVGFAEPRYLLPLLPLLGVVLALAARGARRRWGPSVGVLIVVLVLAHDVFSQLLVVARYYA